MSSLPNLLEGALVTIRLTFFSLLLGLVLAIPIAFGQIYGPKFVRKLIGVYERVVRSIPLLVILFLIFYGFPRVGIRFPAFIAAVIGIGVRSSAYQSQIFRGSIQSLGSGQMMAARSLGMTNIQAILNIILPQALRISIPGWSNEYPILLTDSAVTYAIGVMEILTRGSLVVSRTYQPMPIYLTCTVIFILLNYGGMKILHILEDKYRIPGFGNMEM